ncbi:hypothetical protein GCM10009858_45420 [Terrabacter carboxydivorans]|uniref:Uncharacterized protein n=1 Tax=Terrabacter carboxydivorans TaxID=619730 RepID=A0ABP5ZWQ6_9MICO
MVSQGISGTGPGSAVSSAQTVHTLNVLPVGGHAMAGLRRRTAALPQAAPSSDTACRTAPGLGTILGDGATRLPTLSARERSLATDSAPQTHSTTPTYPSLASS